MPSPLPASRSRNMPPRDVRRKFSMRARGAVCKAPQQHLPWSVLPAANGILRTGFFCPNMSASRGHSHSNVKAWLTTQHQTKAKLSRTHVERLNRDAPSPCLKAAMHCGCLNASPQPGAQYQWDSASPARATGWSHHINCRTSPSPSSSSQMLVCPRFTLVTKSTSCFVPTNAT